MAQKPSIPKGTRDFSPIEMARRDYIFETITEQFRLFGFHRIETPAMENLSTLMGKYGEEGDKLLFKILNSGDFLKSVSDEELLQRNLPKLNNALCEKGLRYDLTVPFARYVVQHRGDLQMPFKRFQIQPVWRADRPQKGRYREFYQCDADIVGSDSLLNEADLLQLIDNVFDRLKIRVAIKLNNRKILSGIAEILECPDKLVDITVAIDKIEKIGLDAVNEELTAKGLSPAQLERLRPILTLDGDNAAKMSVMQQTLASSPTGMAGIEELKFVVDAFESLGHIAQLDLDFSLARGLNYYTGTIIEVKADSLSGAAKVLFVNFGQDESMQALKMLKVLRSNGISGQLYPDTSKMKKQMGFANSEKIPYVAIIGETELANNTVTLKNMDSGEQNELTLADLIEKLK